MNDLKSPLTLVIRIKKQLKDQQDANKLILKEQQRLNKEMKK